jgi:hypothetical protein
MLHEWQSSKQQQRKGRQSGRQNIRHDCQHHQPGSEHLEAPPSAISTHTRVVDVMFLHNWIGYKLIYFSWSMDNDPTRYSRLRPDSCLAKS